MYNKKKNEENLRDKKPGYKKKKVRLICSLLTVCRSRLLVAGEDEVQIVAWGGWRSCPFGRGPFQGGGVNGFVAVASFNLLGFPFVDQVLQQG